MSGHPLLVVRAGRVAYDAALAWQRALAQARLEGALPDDVLVLLEHPPVVTLGRGTHPGHLLRPEGVPVIEVERGGDVTYHGPGQLVGYPILDLQAYRPDLHWYLRTLEQALMTALDTLGVPAQRRPGYTGVWVGGRKIASIGVHVKRWITWHGFALNVTTDLAAFDRIVPCGIAGVVMTSVARELGGAPDGLWERTVDAVVEGFEEAFGINAEYVEERRPATASLDVFARRLSQ